MGNFSEQLFFFKYKKPELVETGSTLVVPEAGVGGGGWWVEVERMKGIKRYKVYKYTCACNLELGTTKKVTIYSINNGP